MRPVVIGFLLLIIVIGRCELPKCSSKKPRPIVTEESKLTVPQIIEKYGYKCEVHSTTTEDGYIIELHRIPYGKKNPDVNGPAVLVSHGLLGSSADWILSGPEKALGYVLADAGFDVWLLNNRGTTYSRKHVCLDPNEDEQQFWEFTWHEIGLYDLSSNIDYIRNRTNQQKIFFIGHSQGSTTFFALCSEKPEYNDKLKAAFVMAPAVYQEYANVVLPRALAPFQKLLHNLTKSTGIYDIPTTNNLIRKLTKALCSDGSILQPLCTYVTFSMFGYSPVQHNASLLPTIMGHFPSGASIKQIVHFTQQFNSRKFRQFDYGHKNNLERYGTAEPPEYNLKNINLPIHLFYSLTDGVVNTNDILTLYYQLRNVKKYAIVNGRFNHIDFVYGIYSSKVVYSKIVDLMKEL